MEYDGSMTLSPYFFWTVIGGFVCFIAGSVFGFSEHFSSPVAVGAAAFGLWVGLVACYRKAKNIWEHRQRN
jgi:membrane associated rhomboid family serine protease